MMVENRKTENSVMAYSYLTDVILVPQFFEITDIDWSTISYLLTDALNVFDSI